MAVVPSQTHPYGMLKESASMMTGNERYEGFGIDIIQELSKILGFNYTFQVQADNIYGSLSKKTGQWNGMIRKLRDGVSYSYPNIKFLEILSREYLFV